jgi:hypothetical protein
MLAVAAVYCCALREASTVAPQSDAASFALQGWAMTHGNLLLSGWRLADVSFYTIDLPVYALGVLVVGLRPDVVPVCAAAVFTIVVVLAAAVARGRYRGRSGRLAGIMAVLVTVAIMAGPAVRVAGVLTTPDHTGTAMVPLVLALVIDRARCGWRAAALVCGVLTWGLIADPLVLVIGVVPVVAVCLARALRDRAARSEPRSELYLAAGGAASVAGYALVRAVLRLGGGWELDAGGHQFAAVRDLGGNVAGMLQSVLDVFSASPSGGPPAGAGLVLTVIHLALACLVALAAAIALRRLLRAGDLVAVLLTAGIIANLAAYTVLYKTGPATGQDVAPVFGMGAALAGRVLGGPLASAWHRAVHRVGRRVGHSTWLLVGAWAAIVLAVSVPPLVTARPAAPGNAALAAWLEQHGLRSGIGQYWQANSITLDTGGAVTVRGMWDYGPGGGIRPYPWEEDTSLLDPRHNYANFVIAAARSSLTLPSIERRFGRPVRSFRVGASLVLVYGKNLLPDLAGLPAPWPSPVGL